MGPGVRRVPEDLPTLKKTYERKVQKIQQQTEYMLVDSGNEPAKIPSVQQKRIRSWMKIGGEIDGKPCQRHEPKPHDDRPRQSSLVRNK